MSFEFCFNSLPCCIIGSCCTARPQSVLDFLLCLPSKAAKSSKWSSGSCLHCVCVHHRLLIVTSNSTDDCPEKWQVWSISLTSLLGHDRPVDCCTNITRQCEIRSGRVGQASVETTTKTKSGQGVLCLQLDVELSAAFCFSVSVRGSSWCESNQTSSYQCQFPLTTLRTLWLKLSGHFELASVLLG